MKIHALARRAIEKAVPSCQKLGVSNPKAREWFNEIAKIIVGLVEIIKLQEIQMGRTAVAIDKLESQIDLQTLAIGARDQKIASQAILIDTLQKNAVDDADAADLTRVEGQTFDPIPDVPGDTMAGSGGTGADALNGSEGDDLSI